MKKYYIERYEDLSFPHYFIETKLEDGKIHYRLPYRKGVPNPNANWIGLTDDSFELFEEGYFKFINNHQYIGEGTKIIEELSEEEWKLRLIKKSLRK